VRTTGNRHNAMRKPGGDIVVAVLQKTIAIR
jgi:hypothetical protein